MSASGGEAERSWCHTQFQQHKTSLTWSIGDFSKSSLEVGLFIASSKFGFDERNNWSLHLYPNGKTEEKKDFVAVYLHSKVLKTSETVTCHISIVDASGDPTETKKLIYYSNDSAGWEEFISRNSLLEVKDLLLPDDALTVHSDLTMVKKVEKSWTSGSNHRPRSCTKETGKENTLGGDLGQLLKNGDQFSDVVFEMGDAKISAHKVLLMARSPVFAARFQQDMLETQTNTVAIKDIEVHVFSQMLSYMYTNDCTLPNAHFAMQLLAAADKYDIPSLKTLCADYLNENVSEEHVFDVVACADSFGEEKLRKNCVEIICAKSTSILAVDADWKTKSRSNPQVLESILRHLPQKEKLPESLEADCSIESEPAICHSRFVNDVGTLTWRISGFSLCQLENGVSYLSSEFTLRGEKQKWFLQLYPNGQNEDSKGFVSLFLLSKSNDAVLIQSEISITNFNAIKLAKFKLSKMVSVKTGWGRNKFFALEKLLNLPNDELVVRCEITVSKSAILSSKEYIPTALEMHSLAQVMGRIFAKQEYADFTLEINETQIPAHKIILMSRSSLFATMIEEIKTEKSLKVTDTKEDVFRELLRFIYTDKCSLKNVDSASDILVAAHKYDVPHLKAKCVQYLCDHMSVEQVCDVAILALSLQETQLYNYCLDYIGQELPSLNFLVWPMKRLYSHPEILQNIFERYIV